MLTTSLHPLADHTFGVGPLCSISQGHQQDCRDPALSCCNALGPRQETEVSKLKIKFIPWLSVLGAGIQTKRSLVGFPVRAHACVAGQVPSWRGNQTVFLSH